MKKLLGTGLAILVIGGIIGLAAAALFLRSAASDYAAKWVPSIENETVINAKTIEDNIRAISELNTLSYNYTDVGEFSDQKIITLLGHDFPSPFGKKSFIIFYDGEMKIGINMAQVSVEMADGVIVIEMPSPRIMSHSIEEDSVRLYDERSGLLNPISIADYTDFIMDRKQEMEEKAKTTGLFDQAQSNAEKQLEAFLLSFPGISDEFEIRFTNKD